MATHVTRLVTCSWCNVTFWPWQRQQLPLIKYLHLLATRDISFKLVAALLFTVKILLKGRILKMQTSYSSHYLNTPKVTLVAKTYLKLRAKLFNFFMIEVFNFNLEVCVNMSIRWV